MKTIFCDIDGTILKHKGTISHINYEQELLPGVIEKFDEWTHNNYHIVLTTARPESYRSLTENQLREFGIGFHQLVMNLPTGPRYVLNDIKPDGTQTAFGINLVRDGGLGQVQI